MSRAQSPKRPDDSTAAQAALDFPSAADLFPSKGRASPGGDFADWCCARIRATLAEPCTTLPELEWDRGFTERERAYLCELAKIPRELVVEPWAQLSIADRARLLAAFERLRHWLQVHSDFSVRADIAQYAQEVGYKFKTPEPRTPEQIEAQIRANALPKRKAA